MRDRTEIKTKSNIKFIPQKIAQRCPVCNGFGTLKWGEIKCRGCKGRGYVLVPAEMDSIDKNYEQE